MDFTKVSENLKARGYAVQCFATAREAADYLNGAIDGVSVGFGGSMTLEQMGLFERLSGHNRALWHWREGTAEDPRKEALTADVYVTSVNGMDEDGDLINIDGAGNRVTALEHIRRAVSMEPDNTLYQQVLTTLEQGGSTYRRQASAYRGFGGLGDLCMPLCLCWGAQWCFCPRC